MIVRKFGGTSVKDARALSAVLEICSAASHQGNDHTTISHTDALAQVVVLSATAGTTDTLFRLAKAAGSGDLAMMTELIDRIRNTHLQILIDAGVGTNAEVEQTLHEMSRYANGIALLGECTAQSLDMMVSFGEMLSTRIFTAMCLDAGLNATWFDVRNVLRTDTRFTSAGAQFEIIEPLANSLLSPLLVEGAIVVTQGYIGQTEDGRTTTLGRGGSDYSAAILGGVLNAREIQIWTDVSGVYSADPRQVSDARPIPHLSFNEVRELALYGAKVLHPDTISPAIERMIPVRILNTFKPNDAGTTITAEQPIDADIHAVTVLRSCVRVVVHSKSTSSAILEKLSAACVLHLASLDSHAFVIRVADEEVRVKLDVTLADTPHVSENVSIITACGPRASTASTLSRIATAVGESGIGVTESAVGAISEGASRPGAGALTLMTGTNALSVFVVCNDVDVASTLDRLHRLALGG